MDSLMLKACAANQFGSVLPYHNGNVYDAGFIYLAGAVSKEILGQLYNRWKYRMFICMSDEWREALLCAYPQIIRVKRHKMHCKWEQLDRQNLTRLKHCVPSGYQLHRFDENAYNAKPFGHGRNYSSWEAFQQTGCGYVMRYNNEIVSSASSFLTYGNELELDVSTLPQHRQKGLAVSCCAAMLLDCLARGSYVHWDAQNDGSKNMAEKLGYRLHHTYSAFCFIAP